MDLGLPNRDLLSSSQPASLMRLAESGRSAVTISCVIPCWNESRNLPALIPMVVAVLNQIKLSWELIMVDDGSSDGTADVIRPWLAQPGFRLVQLSRNFGKEAAMTAGLELSQGDLVVLMDADMQHPAAMIIEFVEHWRAGADVVYAKRVHRLDEPVTKRWGASAFYRLLNTASRFEVPSGAGDFRLMDRAVVNALLTLPERNRFMKGMYAWVGFKSIAIPYVPDGRYQGKTSFSPLTLLRMSFDGLTAFTTWPLKAVSTVGFLMAFLGFVYGAAISINQLVYGNPVSGWTTIVVCMLLFCGIQLVSLGVIGEYIGRVFEEVKQRPVYIVKNQSKSSFCEPP